MKTEIAILQLMHARGLGPRKLSRLLKRLTYEQYMVHDFIFAPKSQLHEEYSLSDEIISEIKMGREKAEQLAQELDCRGIRILYRGGDRLSDETHKCSRGLCTARPLWQRQF